MVGATGSRIWTREVVAPTILLTEFRQERGGVYDPFAYCE